MIGVKGTTLHRVLGWSWVAAMGTTAISSLFIRELNHGSFSFIHLISGWVIIALPMALWAIRDRAGADARADDGGPVRGRPAHRRASWPFIPGRLMWRLFFG